MTRTGRPKSPERMVKRTVRNRPDVDAVLVRMAAKYAKGLAEVLREACEEKAKREGEG